ncbi:MAG TPA: hypothetical protein VM939_10845 [Gemmatimonadaceae bacterium]|nr:hypothetical protein [Gemmatimonadaceae bacterium]
MRNRLLPLLAVGVAYPYLELAWKRRAGLETSEGCVWGKAYLPLARWLELLIVTPIAFLVLTLLARCGTLVSL